MTPEERGKRIQRRIVLLLGALGCVVLGFSIGLITGTRAEQVSTLLLQEVPPQNVDFMPVWKAWRIIDERFVPAAVSTSSPTTTASVEQERVWGMISGLTSSLDDPYTFFLPPVENQIFAEDMNGSFEGVGMEIAIRDQMLTVVSPLKNTPAERAGLKSGDKITHINGVETRNLDITGAVRRIRGPKGSAVTLTIVREGLSEPKDISVVRDVIDVPTITTERKTGNGEEEPGTLGAKRDVFVIQLMNFSANSAALFRNALREFVETGSPHLIIDLRGNPGGYLEAAVEIASWFLPAGKVVVEEDYAGNASNIVHRSRGYDVFNKNLKLVILIDKGSASASEIFAQALRHYGKATLVGESTFGKGSVQELVDITSDTALKITVARWLGPDGLQIPHSGIVPDVEVKITDEEKEQKKDPQMEKAIKIVSSE